MLANVTRQLHAASIYIAFTSIIISGCQSQPPSADSDQLAPPTLNTETSTSSLFIAQQLLSSQNFLDAEATYQNLLETSTDQNTLQQSLAGLALCYLHPNSPIFNSALATASIDRLYQQMMRWPQNEPSLDILFFSLSLSLEQLAQQQEEIALREKAEIQQRLLAREITTLQRAIEKLRQLGLQ
ncbi:Uncharacterised protein [Zhongshania aliphaticivorans]|uniref:Outer membrane protein assembly factor BamD n=1 Tax=Zhongshania aliphaticivorans TaxID=1470434 RepID=A0A5S9NX12_9GAMM|nr:hypothetical protein [Zhongshania aliphaticivorans]CAA0095214.1 Uncharacterised protein [Zhongshania aliphaticivorans]CAA0113003.1 Uncharacterised protein [Zhongshania aliphaticivorans]